MKIRLVGAELFHAGRRTDRHAMVTVASCSLANTPQNLSLAEKGGH